MKIFLDVDGVLADFVGAALAVHDCDDPWETNHHNLGKYELANLIGLCSNSFWAATNHHDFWANLDPLPDGRSLVGFLEKEPHHIFFATSPTLSPHCSSGKHEWIEKHYPRYSRKSFIGAAKEIFGHIPNSLLIDDNDTNVEKFRMAGGQAILWPQPWNSGFQFRMDRIDYFADAFAKVLNGKSFY